MVFGIAAGMLVSEIVLRVAGYSPEFVNPSGAFHRAHPVIGWIGRPDFVGRLHKPEFDVEIAHDARGFRRQEHMNPRSSTKHAVYALGDSFTWGWGVGQGEVFTDQMSLLLPDRRVDNLGLNASGTAVQFQIFDLFVRERLEPGDVIIVTFFFNDFWDNAYGSSRGVIGDDNTVRFEAEQVENGTFDPRRRSYLINLLAFEWNYRKAVRKARAEAESIASRMSLHDEQIVITRHYLAAFRDAAIDAGARFLVMRIPERWEYGERPGGGVRDENTRIYRDSLAGITGELDIETIDVLPGFREAHLEDPDTHLAFPHDGHWTARGHAVAAGVIAARLAEPAAVGGP